MTTTFSHVTLWEKTLNALREEIDEESFEGWLQPVHCKQYVNGELELRVPSDFFRNWLTSNYLERIEECVEGITGRPVTVIFTVDPAPDAIPGDRDQGDRAAPGARSATGGGRSPIFARFPLNPNYTFENFIVGESNRFANAAGLAVADPQSRAYNPLMIYGGVGLGKTHMMHAIGQRMLTYGPHFNVIYLSSEVFMNSFIEAIRLKRMSEFRDCFRKVDLLLLDDVQFLAGAERSQTEFFHTFNALFDTGKKIVISSDHPPKELTDIEERLRSRFEAGLIVDIQPPDLETRVAILLGKAEEHSLDLPQEVAIFVAERIKTNIRKLEGALKKLAAHCAVTREPIVIDTARRLLGPLLAGEEPIKISVEKIQLAVCKFFDLNLHDLTGSNRARKYTVPRQIAIYLSRQMTDCSFPEIARKFGGRDHTSIMHACRKVARELEGDLNRQNLIKYLTKLIKEEPFSEKLA